MTDLVRPLIRRIRPDDGPAWRALRLEMLADTPIAYVETVDQAETRPVESWSERAASRAAGDREATFLAESAGQIVASAGGMTDERGRTIIVSVYITPAFRGTGLIGRLVEEIAAWSLAAGRKDLVLDVAMENPRAVAAYARLGFVPTGGTTPHPLYPDVTEQEMVRPASVSLHGRQRGPRTGENGAVTGWQRLRTVVNWINLMTPLGLAAAVIGRSQVRRGPSGLWICSGYRLRFPVAGAFTIGNVINTKHPPEYLLAPQKARLLHHESRHSVQAAIFGPFFLPLYGFGQLYSWLVSGDHGGRNLFERWAGLEDGGYLRHPVRPGLARFLTRFRVGSASQAP